MTNPKCEHWQDYSTCDVCHPSPQSPSEIFEGPDSSLRKTFEEVASRSPQGSKELEAMVRDFTTVAPRAKSEVRGRIVALLTTLASELVAETDQQKKEVPEKCACGNGTRCVWHIQYGSWNDALVSTRKAQQKVLAKWGLNLNKHEPGK